MNRDLGFALTSFLAARPEAVARLLADHTDDGTGHCRTCAVGGQRGYHSWPCSIAAAAHLADLHEEDGPDLA